MTALTRRRALRSLMTLAIALAVFAVTGFTAGFISAVLPPPY